MLNGLLFLVLVKELDSYQLPREFLRKCFQLLIDQLLTILFKNLLTVELRILYLLFLKEKTRLKNIMMLMRLTKKNFVLKAKALMQKLFMMQHIKQNFIMLNKKNYLV